MLMKYWMMGPQVDSTLQAETAISHNSLTLNLTPSSSLSIISFPPSDAAWLMDICWCLVNVYLEGGLKSHLRGSLGLQTQGLVPGVLNVVSTLYLGLTRFGTMMVSMVSGDILLVTW